MKWLEILNLSNVKGGIGVALAILFVLSVVAAMISPLPFKENAAWVLVGILVPWLGLTFVGLGINRVTDYTYAAIKAGQKAVPDTTTTTVVKTTDAPSLSVDDR